MLNRVQTFSRWLLLAIASLILAACGSGDGDNVLPVAGVSNFQLTLVTANSVINGAGTTTVTATLLTPTGAPASGQTIALSQTGAGSIASSSAVTNASGQATISVSGGVNGVVTPGAGSVTARYVDPSSNIATRTLSYSVSSGDQIILSLDKPQVKSGAGDSVTITARVTDTNGSFIQGRSITFATSGGINNGLIQVTDPVTDSTGTAKAVFTPGTSNFSNRTVELIVSSNSGINSVENRISVSVVGTTLTLINTGASNITLGDTVTAKAKALDGNGNPISGATVSFSSANSNIAATNVITNAAGEATVSVPVSTASGGLETINATSSALNASASPLAISVTGTRFEFETTSNEFKTGTPVPANTITVRWREGSTPKSGRQVLLTVTRGTLTPANGIITLDGAGRGTATINSDTAGTVTVEAQTIAATPPVVGEVQLQISRTFEFVATTPTQVSVQVAQNVLAPGQQTAVTAVVRDADNNPVKNRTVAFSNPTDPSNGSLSAATAVTGSDGVASVIYTAGAGSSSTNGVTLRAADQSTGLFSTTALTVGGGAAFITLGTGNTIREVDASTYGLPYTVLLTNSAGQPIANQTVTLSVTPLRYFKGVYVAGIDSWIATSSIPGGCINEDADLDGILDPNENDGATTAPDDNADGVLWPGNVITISSGTVTTNASGFANFEVQYPQQYGHWVEVALKASRNVAGTESVNTAVFVPPISADDAKLDQAPPGRFYSSPSAVGSPYGRGASCLSVD